MVWCPQTVSGRSRQEEDSASRASSTPLHLDVASVSLAHISFNCEMKRFCILCHNMRCLQTHSACKRVLFVVNVVFVFCIVSANCCEHRHGTHILVLTFSIQAREAMVAEAECCHSYSRGDKVPSSHCLSRSPCLIFVVNFKSPSRHV